MQKNLAVCEKCRTFAAAKRINIQMKVKKNRLETLRMIISSQQMGSQEELLGALQAAQVGGLLPSARGA